jgi:hypothetical protein
MGRLRKIFFFGICVAEQLFYGMRVGPGALEQGHPVAVTYNSMKRLSDLVATILRFILLIGVVIVLRRDEAVDLIFSRTSLNILSVIMLLIACCLLFRILVFCIFAFLGAIDAASKTVALQSGHRFFPRDKQGVLLYHASLIVAVVFVMTIFLAMAIFSAKLASLIYNF